MRSMMRFLLCCPLPPVAPLGHRNHPDVPVGPQTKSLTSRCHRFLGMDEHTNFCVLFKEKGWKISWITSKYFITVIYKLCKIIYPNSLSEFQDKMRILTNVLTKRWINFHYSHNNWNCTFEWKSSLDCMVNWWKCCKSVIIFFKEFQMFCISWTTIFWQYDAHNVAQLVGLFLLKKRRGKIKQYIHMST